MKYRSSIQLLALMLLISTYPARPAGVGEEWLPITPEELKMTSEPKAPGAPAILLYRQVDRNDSTRIPHEFNYIREKIFTEEGRKYADVEIPFIAKIEKVQNIRARTIHPDGTIVEFDGKVFDKEIVKARGFKYLAKTFSLPDVQPGSIIEYHYVLEFKEGYVFDSHWILSEELYTKHARFSLVKNPWMPMQMTWPNGLPEGSSLPTKEGFLVRLESQNIPAFQIEDDMPPPDSVRFKVDFIYGEADPENDPEKFWKKQGIRINGEVERFVEKHKAIDAAIAGIVSPGDSPEVKLQKLYARAQQIRNTSFELEKTEQEHKRDKEKEIKSAEEVWKQGRGNWVQINWTFLALARAAGFEAYVVMLASRNGGTFNPKLRRVSDLNSNAVVVLLKGAEVYLNPGTIFTSFGFLPAGNTGTKGLRLDKDGGKWVTTTTPDSFASQIVRKADLKLDADGALQGKLSIMYTGLEAVWRRYEERYEDEASRRKFLEDNVKESIPMGAEIELVNKPDWASSAPTLAAEFALKVPGWVSAAGRRELLPVGLFGAAEKHVCERTVRVHPLYYQYKFQKVDDIRIELPAGWQVSSLPQAVTRDVILATYNSKVENEKGTLHLERLLKSELISLGQEHYEMLRGFYQTVRNGDEQQVVLQPGGTTGSN